MLNINLDQYSEQTKKLLKESLSALKPAPKISVVDWVNRYGILPFGAEQGRYSTERIPYINEILLEATNPRIEQIVVRKSAQTGLTTALLQHILYTIDCDPANTLYVMPTESMANSLMRERIEPLLQETPKIKDKVSFSHHSGNTLDYKKFRGGQLNLSSASAPSGLQSRPVRYLFLDEVSRFPDSAKDAGDPCSLAIKRTTTYLNRLIWWISTPSITGLCRISKAFDESDQRYFKVPCKVCGEHQTMLFKYINYINDDPKTAHYTCPHCGAFWTDLERWQAVKLGQWERTKETNKIAGFQLNELMSPWSTAEQIVESYLVAVRGGPELIKQWTNESEGMPFNENLEETDISTLYDRREDFDSQSIPNEVRYLCLGTDTQDHSLHSTLVGFGLNQECYVLDHFIIQGSPAEDETFEELEKIRTAKYKKQDGTLMTIAVHCQDSAGHFVEQCYRWSNAMLKKGIKSYAVKSISGHRPIFPRTPSRSTKYKGLTFYQMGSDTTKQMTFDRIKITEVGKYYIHFGKNLSIEYFQELTNEFPKYNYDKKGRLKKEWIQKGRNEAFDTMGLCWASLYAHLNHYQLACNETPQITPKSVRHSSYLERIKNDT